MSSPSGEPVIPTFSGRLLVHGAAPRPESVCKWSRSLFGVEGFDLPTFVGFAVLFLALSALASYPSARRLLRVGAVMVLK